MTYDERRIDNRRNGLAPCMIVEKKEPQDEGPKGSKNCIDFVVRNGIVKAFESKIFRVSWRSPKKKIKPFLTIQGFILIVTAALLSIGIYGASQIRIYHDWMTYIHDKSNVWDFHNAYKDNFRVPGYPSELVDLHGFNYTLEGFERINQESIISNW